MKLTVLNPFTLDLDEHSIAHGTANDEPSLTVQSDKQQADINFIVKQFGLTGGLPYGNRQPVYDDFSMIPMDYHEAMNFIKDADSQFMELPAETRARFNNDAGAFISALGDESMRPVFEQLGMVLPKTPEPSLPQVNSEPVSDKA